MVLMGFTIVCGFSLAWYETSFVLGFGNFGETTVCWFWGWCCSGTTLPSILRSRATVAGLQKCSLGFWESFVVQPNVLEWCATRSGSWTWTIESTRSVELGESQPWIIDLTKINTFFIPGCQGELLILKQFLDVELDQNVALRVQRDRGHRLQSMCRLPNQWLRKMENIF